MTDLTTRFWAKVDTSAGPDACWPWLGATNWGGYGQIWADGRPRSATHLALQLAGRPLVGGEEARHTCDNPPCVNPAHLLAGTQRDNLADMVARGRALVGARNLNALSLDLVPAIAAAHGTQRQVAARFRVSQWSVGVIRRGEHWSQKGVA